MSYSRSPLRHTGYNSHSVGEVEEAEKVSINWVKHELAIVRPGLSAPITRELTVHHMRLFCTCTLLLFPTMLLTCNFVLLRHLLLDQLSKEPLLPVDPDTPGSVAECHAVILLVVFWIPRRLNSPHSLLPIPSIKPQNHPTMQFYFLIVAMLDLKGDPCIVAHYCLLKEFATGLKLN